MGIVLRQVEGQTLLLISRRRSDQVLAGYWEFPGGKIEANESPEDCVRRELREEVGLAVCVTVALPVIEHHYAHASVRLRAYVCTYQSGEAQPLQVADCRWIKPAELPHYAFPPANAPLLSQLQPFLACR